MYECVLGYYSRHSSDPYDPSVWSTRYGGLFGSREVHCYGRYSSKCVVEPPEDVPNPTGATAQATVPYYDDLFMSNSLGEGRRLTHGDEETGFNDETFTQGSNFNVSRGS